MAAARAHPAGVAAPSAVIVTAIVLFTFVTWVIVPAIPPGLFGAGSPPAVQPSPDQPRHRIHQQQPVLTGPPVIPALPSSLGRSVTGSAGRPQPVSSPLPPRIAGSPPGSGPAPEASQHLPSGTAGGCPACHAGQPPASAVTTVVAGAGSALQGLTRVLASGSVVTVATGVVAPASGTAVEAVGALASTVTSAAPVVLGGTRSAPIQAGQAAVATVTTTVTGDSAVPAATAVLAASSTAVHAAGAVTSTVTSAAVTAVGDTVQSAAQVPGSLSQGSSGRGGSSQPTAQASPAAQASSGKSAEPTNAPVSLTSSAEDSVEQALPATGTLPGVG